MKIGIQTVICAWCKRLLQIGIVPGPVSHGCCAECAEKVLAE